MFSFLERKGTDKSKYPEGINRPFFSLLSLIIFSISSFLLKSSSPIIFLFDWFDVKYLFVRF